ncbi:MAG: PQQ-binding-like beta-propeller repeat protein [Gemmatales bacterium]|nr:PQQ-binding-like beta-propeller repeat protein [Gemmatales bacterium]
MHMLHLPTRCLTLMSALTVLACASATPTPTAQDSASARRAPTLSWPQWRGPFRNGICPETGLLPQWPKDGPPLLWETKGLGRGYSSVAIDAGRIVTMGDRSDACYVICLDADNGKELWSARVGKTGGNYPGPRSTPTIDGDYVYALGQFGDLVCLRLADGREVWRKNFQTDFQGRKGDSWHYSESVLIDGDKLVCTPGGEAAPIVALEKLTGAVLWKAKIPGGVRAGHSSIVIAETGVRQYIQLTADGVVSVRARDGALLWKWGQEQLGRNTANIPTPIVHGDKVFVTAGYGRGGGLLRLVPKPDGCDVQEVYFDRRLNNRHGGVVLVNGYLYGDRDNSGFPWCAEFETGKILWQKTSRGPGEGSAAILYADGKLYIRYDNGVMALVEASPKEYREISTFRIPRATRQSWAHPVICQGKLYLREQDYLLCYQLRP